MLTPIRERRQHYARDPQAVMDMLKTGTVKARETAAQTLDEVKRAMGMVYD